MRGTVLYGPGDIRFEELETPKIVEPTDAILRLALTCVCGSDLWPYRGLQPINSPTPMGHEYCGIVEEVGSAVKSVKPGQFGVGSFADFMARAKTESAGIEYVSAGVGTVGNWVAEYLAAKTGIKLTHVAYKGGANAVLDLDNLPDSKRLVELLRVQ